MVDVGELVQFSAGERTLRLVMDIAAALERYRIVMEGPSGVRLRKLNHIRTVRGTTAIEGNTLTEAQVTAVIAGKRVVGLKREIDEVKGAHAAYSGQLVTLYSSLQSTKRKYIEECPRSSLNPDPQ